MLHFIYRRLGIGTKLVKHLEEWCEQKGAEYAYMATDCSNEPSINLFTKCCDYTKFRTLTMLVQPVHAHYKSIGSNIAIFKLPTQLAELFYHHIFAKSEFFPEDLDTILGSKLNLGTFIALPKECLPKWNRKESLLPPNFALLSIWNAKDVFKLQVKGVSRLKYACCAGTRMLDSWMPWLKLPSIPDVFRQFGVYFMYGLHMEGKHGLKLMKSLCNFAYNMARDDAGCEAVVAEVGHRDPVRMAIPHWRKFSMAEDLWCIKRLGIKSKSCEPSDWISSRPSSSVVFADPRDF